MERTPQGGGLSDQERRLLAELEERLASDDQGLARRMRQRGSSPVVRSLLALLLPLGLVTMLLGVNLNNGAGIGVGVLGYLLMLVGGVAAWQLSASAKGRREDHPRR